MRKYINLAVCTAILLTTIGVHAEELEEFPNISAAVIGNSTITEDISEQSVEDETKSTEGLDEKIDEDNSVTIIAMPENEAEPFSLNPPTGDKWVEIGNMNEARADCDLVTVNGEIYAVGGLTETGYSVTIEKYVDVINMWETVTTIPNAPNGYAVAANKDKIYIIGGYRNGKYLNEVQVYDTAYDTWSNVANMKTKRDQAAAMSIDNKLYVFGGRSDNGFASSYEVYDAEQDSWKKVLTGFDRSMIRIGAKAAYFKGYVCIYGGINENFKECGVSLYAANDLNKCTAVLENEYESVSMCIGQDKALVFAHGSKDNAMHEIVINNGNISVMNVVGNDELMRSKYPQYIIHNGYIYGIGGYAESAYSAKAYKYSVYYGDYNIGEGKISDKITEYGNSITFNADAGEVYLLFLNAKNVASFDNYTFTVEYPADSFTIEDGCMFTIEKNCTKGAVQGTNINITELASNGISFVINESIPMGMVKSRTVNAILLRAESSGQRTINYSMTKD